MDVDEVKFFKPGDVVPSILIDPKYRYRTTNRFLIDVILIKKRGVYNQRQWILSPLYKEVTISDEIFMHLWKTTMFRCTFTKTPPSLKELIQYT